MPGKAIAPNATHHYVMMGIKDSTLDDDKYALPLVGVRQTGFEDGNEIETETDEGHTGVANLNMGSYRTTAESSPNWEDKIRFGEGLEDIMYLTLGHYTKTAHESVEGLYDYVFELPATATDELPFATIYNGFAKTCYDARVFNNAMLNELEFNMSSDDAPTIKPTFVSDYNNFNLKNPTRSFADDFKSRFAKAQWTTAYLGDVGATAEEMLANPVDCFTEASFTINHNAESQSCHADAFGKNTKIMGSREVEGSITMPWTELTKHLETEYEGYEKYSHIVSEEITNKQIWYKVEGGNITRYSDSDTLATGEKIIKTIETDDGEGGTITTYVIATGIPYSILFKFPEVEITNVESPKSGDEAKDLTMEWSVLEKPTQSYMTVDMVTDLAALHIDAVGTTLTDLEPTSATWYENPLDCVNG